MAAQVIVFPIARRVDPPTCTECYFGQMRNGELLCELADDFVTDVVAEAADCEEYSPWSGER